MKRVYIVMVAISISLTSFGKVRSISSHIGNEISFLLKKSYRKVWAVHVSINLGFCQASGTITYTTNDITGDIHAYYSLSTNCGGGIHGSAGQFFRTGEDGTSDLVVDPASITYEYESEDVMRSFESNSGKTQLEEAINESVNIR